jgi:ubiquinone/menaquinone biosynthesis C-methylase UbiE
VPSIDTAFTGSIPAIYDTNLVPLLFEPYAADMAGRVAAGSPSSVLETAAGSGVVTRVLAPRLPARARYVVTDLNQAMLDRAISRQPPDRRIEWKQADALDLPFDDRSFDVVCCQFGAMFFPDKVRGYAEALRVLRPGGRFVFNVWDRIEHNEFADLVTTAGANAFPDDPPLFLARTPHGYHDVGAIRSDLTEAGFARIEINTLAKRSEAASPRHAAVGLCQGSPLRTEIEARDPSKLELVTDLAEQAIAQKFGAGPVSGNIQAHMVVAEAPR